MADTTPRKDLLRRALDRAERLLFPRDRSADRASTARRGQAYKSRRALKIALQRTAIALCSVGFVLGFVFAVYYYSTTRMRIEQHPLVTNLTAAGLKARVTFVAPNSCGDGELHCWAQDGVDDASWQIVRVPMLPTAALQTLEGYKAAPKDGYVVYRMSVPTTDPQRAQPDELSFTPVYLNHSQYAVYLNGRLVHTGNGKSLLGSQTNVAIPRGDLKNGAARVTVIGTYESELPGLANRAAAYIGPKPVLDDIYIHYERVNGTFHLLFLLTKGGIFVVFALFFIFSKGQRGLFPFLVFSFFLTIENLFLGAFFDGVMGYLWRDAIVIVSKFIAVNALFAYFADFYEIHRKKRVLRVLGTLSVVLGTAMVYDYGWGTHSVTTTHLLGVTNSLLVGVIAFGIASGGVTYRMWGREGFPAAAQRNLRNFLLFLGLYLGLLVWEFGFNAYYGFDKRPLFDLLLFYFMAFITARDMGDKEGQVRTLEAHMIEKRRMEVELQEAAAIAKVFLPGSLPDWEPLAIQSHHQPLTENSGDWFAFERARGRPLYHFLMCDVTGHGVQAAIIVSACKTVLSLMIQNQPELLERTDFVMHYSRALNAVLFKQGEGQHMSTLLGLTFDAAADEVHYASGGHPSPILVQNAENGGRPGVSALVTRNTVLGTLPDVEFKMASRKLAVGEAVLAYTDGLPLSPNIKVLREAVGHEAFGDADALSRLFTSVWEAHTAKTSQTPDDDVSIVCFRYRGLTSSRPARGSGSSAS